MYALSSVFATLYAMVSKVQTYEFQNIDVPNNDTTYEPFDKDTSPSKNDKS